jgi:membrane-bound metal-dependent hydrolase YbcI (DUF457 family)
MFAIGHFALGYLAGKGSSSLLKVKINIPLLLVLAVLPDIDLFLQQFDDLLFMHRGATHSIVTFTVLMIPFFIKYRKQAIPYYAVLLSHSLIGDFFTGGIELFWPVSQIWVGNFLVEIGSLTDVAVEFSLFAVSTALMFKAGDLQRLLKPKKYNWILLIALGAVVGPMLARTRGFESSLPLLLVPPSIFWVVLLFSSLLIGLGNKLSNIFGTGGKSEASG